MSLWFDLHFPDLFIPYVSALASSKGPNKTGYGINRCLMCTTDGTGRSPLVRKRLLGLTKVRVNCPRLSKSHRMVSWAHTGLSRCGEADLEVKSQTAHMNWLRKLLHLCSSETKFGRGSLAEQADGAPAARKESREAASSPWQSQWCLGVTERKPHWKHSFGS